MFQTKAYCNAELPMAALFNNAVTTEDDYSCAIICSGGTSKTNTVEVYSMDQTDPNSTPNNGFTTEDDIASVDIVICTACTVVAGASITLSPVSPVVAGTTVNLTATKTDAGTPTTYTWTANPNTGFTSTNENAVLTNPSVGTYDFTVTIQNTSGTGTCVTMATASLIVVSGCTKPTDITLSKTAPTCTGATANNDGKITLSSATGADKYGISTIGAANYDGPAYASATAYVVNKDGSVTILAVSS